MPEAIVNTSPLVYLYRIGALDWLHRLFDEVWVPLAVVQELEEGRQKGHQVPQVTGYTWLRVVKPQTVISEWLATDLGPGEVSVIALGLENPGRIVLLDDARARRIATAAGLQVWGTLRVILEAKASGLIDRVAPVVDQLRESGMWISEDIRRRILVLAGELPDKEEMP